ncbi:MAG: cbb3-type cytochrome oxidase assembly protein CcoS [Proteobacteria bacterium]|nr:MAG: cbb3-type cytochrome oxidase assembly protein CcoS [Pseudomonadota bacterium]
MEVIYLLIPIAAILVAVIVAGFIWAVRSGQFDDLEGPAYSILMDDDDEYDLAGRTRTDKELEDVREADDDDRRIDVKDR